jgi:hypothetical protein
MQHLPQRRILAALSALVFATTVAACSDSGDDEDEGVTGGSSSGATGGSSTGATGGSSGSGTGGSSGAGKGGSTTGGSSTGGSTTGGSSTGGSSTGGSTTGGSSTGGSSSGGTSPSQQCSGLPFEGTGGDMACAGFEYEVEPVPVDLFIMMDRSVSMNELLEDGVTTRWEALHDAVESFVSTENNQLRVGISFFNRTGAADDNLDCDVDYYATPYVEIGELDEAGPEIVQAMEDVVPGGLTPTLPALQGAIQHAREWAETNAGRATAVLLVTDGYPTQCQEVIGINQVVEVAEDGYLNEPYIRTYVFGLAADFNLDSVALGGGTRNAYIVDEGDVSGSFANALANVAGSRLACKYELPTPPAGMNLNLDEVQIVYTTATGESEEVPRITSGEACARKPNGGWYYDDPTDPSTIEVCSCTCQRFQAGSIEVRLGCEPRVGIR